MNIRQKDKKYLGREGSPQPLIFEKAEGSYVYDDKGRRYIDFFMGWCVGNIGWNVPEVVKEISKFTDPTYVTPGYYYKYWDELAELLAKITPGTLQKSFRATGGTEAIEIAIQASMKHTGRHKFISIENSYHGHSIGAMSIGGSYFREWYPNLLDHCNKINAPLDEKAARKVEKLLSTREIAAFISEPIICNLAVEIPTKEFFRIVQAACKKYGTVFVIDEVATGFGRTGKLFGAEHYDLEPDIMTMGKGLTGGFGGLGAAIMTPEVAKSFEFDFSYYSTFGWHPLNVGAALANVHHILKHKTALLKNANKSGEYIKTRLEKMKFKHPVKIRVKGLAVGILFENSDYPSAVTLRALKKGLLVSCASAQDITLFPALNIDQKALEEGMDILEKCV